MDAVMEGPTMTSTHPLANRVQIQVSLFLPPQVNLPWMMVAVQIPYEIDGPMRALREAFLATLSNVPMNVYDRHPIFPMFNMSIKIMIWNVQGKLNKLPTIREVIRINKPSSEQAQSVCNKFGLSEQLRVEAQGFSGGIWLFWHREEVIVTPYDNHTQHATVTI